MAIPRDQVVPYAAGAVASGKYPEEIVLDLADAGMERAEALQLVTDLARMFEELRRADPGMPVTAEELLSCFHTGSTSTAQLRRRESAARRGPAGSYPPSSHDRFAWFVLTIAQGLAYLGCLIAPIYTIVYLVRLALLEDTPLPRGLLAVWGLVGGVASFCVSAALYIVFARVKRLGP
jgi:hypothetical protein